MKPHLPPHWVQLKPAEIEYHAGAHTRNLWLERLLASTLSIFATYRHSIAFKAITSQLHLCIRMRLARGAPKACCTEQVELGRCAEVVSPVDKLGCGLGL